MAISVNRFVSIRKKEIDKLNFSYFSESSCGALNIYIHEGPVCLIFISSRLLGYIRKFCSS